MKFKTLKMIHKKSRNPRKSNYNLAITIELILLLSSSCGFFQKEMPNVRIEFATSRIAIEDDNFYIDSIALKNYVIEQPFYALKYIGSVSTGKLNTIVLGSLSEHYKRYGNLDSACERTDLTLEIFIREKSNDAKEFHTAVYYKCKQDTFIITKPDGKI
jgi:hypothetical protein